MQNCKNQVKRSEMYTNNKLAEHKVHKNPLKFVKNKKINKQAWLKSSNYYVPRAREPYPDQYSSSVRVLVSGPYQKMRPITGP